MLTDSHELQSNTILKNIKETNKDEKVPKIKTTETA